MDYVLNKVIEDILEKYLYFEIKNFIYNYLINSFNWLDLVQEWCNYRFSYNENVVNFEKFKYFVWVYKCFEIIELFIDFL